VRGEGADGHAQLVSALHLCAPRPSRKKKTNPSGTGCPACAGKVVTATNNLQAWCGKNGREDVLRSGRKRDTMSAPGHTKPSGKGGCPVCRPIGRPRGRVVPLPTAANNLQVWCGATGREDLLGEWAHPDKGPLEVTRGSSEKVPWKCGKCGGTWEARIAQGLADIARHVIQRT